MSSIDNLRSPTPSDDGLDFFKDVECEGESAESPNPSSPRGPSTISRQEGEGELPKPISNPLDSAVVFKPIPISQKDLSQEGSSSYLSKIAHLAGVTILSVPAFVWLKPVPASMFSLFTYHVTGGKNLHNLKNSVEQATRPLALYLQGFFSLFERPQDVLSIKYDPSTGEIYQLELNP